MRGRMGHKVTRATSEVVKAGTGVAVGGLCHAVYDDALVPRADDVLGDRRPSEDDRFRCWEPRRDGDELISVIVLRRGGLRGSSIGVYEVPRARPPPDVGHGAGVGPPWVRPVSPCKAAAGGSWFHKGCL